MVYIAMISGLSKARLFWENLIPFRNQIVVTTVHLKSLRFFRTSTTPAPSIGPCELNSVPDRLHRECRCLDPVFDPEMIQWGDSVLICVSLPAFGRINLCHRHKHDHVGCFQKTELRQGFTAAFLQAAAGPGRFNYLLEITHVVDKSICLFAQTDNIITVQFVMQTNAHFSRKDPRFKNTDNFSFWVYEPWILPSFWMVHLPRDLWRGLVHPNQLSWRSREWPPKSGSPLLSTKPNHCSLNEMCSISH